MNNIVEFVKSDTKVSAVDLFNDSVASLLIVLYADNDGRVGGVNIFRNTHGRWFHSDDFFRIIVCNEPEVEGKVHYNTWLDFFENAIEKHQSTHNVESQLKVFEMVGHKTNTPMVVIDNR